MLYLQEFLISNPLIELWLVTLVLVVLWYIVKSLRQPILIWYILWWLLLGPQWLDLIHHYWQIEVYAYFGVSLLLFMVWLWLNPAIIKEVWKVAAIAWTWQVIFTSVIGFMMAMLLWFDLTASILIAIWLTFSSTIVIVKLVSDRWDSNTTYGKIALGILIVQDIIAMLILLAISSSAIDMWDQSIYIFVWYITLKVLWLLSIAVIAANYILPKIIQTLSKQKELLLLFVITRAILFGGLRYYAWFSMEIWALLAWIALANSRYRFHIFSELRPFRDFFLALFFVYLWGQIVFDNMTSMIVPILLFSAFVLIWNPIIVISILMKLWYGSKDSFMTGLTVAQISEFSFIVVGLALTTGIIDDPNILSLVTIIWLITMTWSSYMFAYADKIYTYIEPHLKKREQNTWIQEKLYTQSIYKVVVVWYGRLGKYIATKLRTQQIPFCIVDSDMHKVELAIEKWYNAIYGHIQDTDMLSNVVCQETQIIYSTVADHDINIQLLTKIHDDYDHIRFVVVAQYLDEAEHLYSKKADYVIFPHMSWAHESRRVLEQHFRDPEEFISSKIQNREALHIHKTHI